MNYIVDFGIAFLLLGFVEALVKPIAKQFVQRRIVNAAGLLLPVLDPLMPEMMAKHNGAQLEQIARTKLEVLTGESWTHEDMNEIFRLYDPRINADSIQA